MICLSWKKRLVAVLVLGGLKIGIMYAINRLVNHISTKDNRLGKIEPSFYNWRFGRIFYTKQGSGKPLLLVHDLNVSSSAYEWDKVVETLAKTYTVYTIDLLGCGRSDKPNLTYTNFLYVQLISDFIKYVIDEKTDVIATGESGAFTLAACAHDDSIIDQIALVNPKDFISLAKVPTKRTKLLRYLLCTPIAGTFLYNIFINKRTIEKSFYSSYYYDCDKISEESILTYFESSQRDKTRSKFLYASLASRYTNANIIHNLKNLNNNIFIIAGNSNPKNMLTANQYQNQLPSIEIVSMDEAKHLPHMESPKEFWEQIKILFDVN